MELFLIAFAAGFLTVLTPCVLPVLPVILGGSLSGTDKWRPLIISASLMVSVFAFTLLLKASTLLIDIPQSFWTSVAGVIVLIFGLALLFPSAWSWLSVKLGFERSQELLQSAGNQEGSKGMILLGLSLGPVFASCSPTYAIILAVVLPQSFTTGVWALVFYCLGLFVPLLLIGYGGRRFLSRFAWFADPTSSFRKGLGLLLVLVALLIMTGYDKKLEAALLDQGYFDFTKLEQGLVDNLDDMEFEEENEVPEPSPEQSRIEQLLNVNYDAPELQSEGPWINSEALTLAGLQAEGKVVVVDFWTYSCINCIRTLPALRGLHEMYSDEGLVIIGVHAPEFAFEKKVQNVQNAVNEFELEYPVVLDNDFQTWRAYRNRYWPAKYIIDKQGKVRYTHFGEGAYEETEEVIRYLLGEEAGAAVDFSEIESSRGGVRTGETYLGTARHVVVDSLKDDLLNRQAVFVSPETVSEDSQQFTRPSETEENQWWLEGQWTFDEEKVVSQSDSASIGLTYTASQANLVMGFQEEPVNVEIWLDGEQISPENAGRMLEDGQLTVDDFKLYYLSDHGQAASHELELRFEGPGVELYAWTFG